MDSTTFQSGEKTDSKSDKGIDIATDVVELERNGSEDGKEDRDYLVTDYARDVAVKVSPHEILCPHLQVFILG